MATDPLDVWLDEFEKIPQDPTGDLAPKNLAEFVDQRVTSKLETSSQVVEWTPAPAFTWQKATFESTLRILCKIPSQLPLAPAIKMATAWKTATLISTFLIQPMAKMNPPAPATTGIASTAGAVIDPASVEIAYAYLLAQLSSVVPVSNQKGAVFPRAFRQAFLMITYTISGMDTTTPPAGPIPFMYPMTPVQ